MLSRQVRSLVRVNDELTVHFEIIATLKKNSRQMDKIRNKLSITDDILPVCYWDITKSGKVLELRVKPSIDQQPAKFRLGIIQIGRIISRIQTLAEQSGSQPQIQLFPNLSENQLAATVYSGRDYLRQFKELNLKKCTVPLFLMWIFKQLPIITI